MSVPIGTKMHKYTPEERKYISDHTEGITSPELAKMFNEKFGANVSADAINAYRSRNGLKCGVDSTFRKGHVPANKGVKGIHVPGTEKTWFKKGQRPANYRPVGSTRISRDGYVEIKVTEGLHAWRPRAKWVYEQAYGPIPRGRCVFHMNGDYTDDRLENLVLLTRSELARLNQDKLITNDVELNKVAINIARIKGVMSERNPDARKRK